MKKRLVKKSWCFAIILLFVGASIMPLVGSRISNKSTVVGNVAFSEWAYEPDIIVPDDYPTIQEALDNANEDTIIGIRNNTYYENIRINENNITLCGDLENKVIIIGDGTQDTIKIDYAREVTIADLWITCSAIESEYSGIHISGDYPQMLRNHIYENGNGIKIISSDYLLISENYICDNTKMVHGCGIYLDDCFDFLINKNYISNLYLRNWSYAGLRLKDSNHYFIEDKGIFCNNIEFFTYGITQDTSTCIIQNNRIANNIYGVENLGPGGPNLKYNEFIDNNISIFMSMCSGHIQHNNFISDSDIYIMKQLGWVVKANYNYWGQEDPLLLWPRRYIMPLFALVLIFPWKLQPVDIPQCWPE